MTDTAAAWTASLQVGEYAQARARAAAHGEDPLLVAALDDLDGLVAALRAKAYSQARRMLARYQQSADESGLVRQLPDDLNGARLHSAGLDAALSALEAAEGPARPSEPAVLSELLAPALAHPLSAPEAHNALGVLYALLGEPAPARAAFEAALTQDPGHYRALTNLGNLLLESGDLEGAEAQYRRALALNGEYAGAHHNLAVVLRKRRRVGESVRALKQSQRLQMRQSRQQGRDELKQVVGGLKLNPRTLQIVTLVVVALALYLILHAQRG